MRHLLLTAAGASMLVAALVPGAGQAQDVRRHKVATVAVQAPPLTVTGRSWLDMGTAARVGTQASYLAVSTTLNQPIYASFDQDRFGRSTLPRQFSLPFNENPRGPESGGIFFDF